MSFNPLPTAIEITTYRFVIDERKLAKLQKDPVASKLMDAARDEVEHDPRTIHMLAGVRLSRAMCPKVFGALDRVTEILGIELECEIYVHPDPLINAGITPASLEDPDAKPVLILSSGAVEKLSEDELLFVLGHEVGHFVFAHHQHGVASICALPEARKYPYQSVQLMSWARSAEISADRIALLCCQDFSTAIRTFFKLASGLGDEHVNADLSVYWEQVKEAQETVFGSSDQLGGMSTHPFSPMRIKALHRFWCWDELADLWKGPKPPKLLTREQVENQTYKLIADMDPDYIRSKGAAKSRADEFFAWAAGMVIAADGIIDDREIKKLTRFVGKERCQEVVDTLRSKNGVDKVARNVSELSVPLRGTASRTLREQMLINLVALSGADGEIDESEVHRWRTSAR